MQAKALERFNIASDMLVFCRDREGVYPELVQFAQAVFDRAADDLRAALYEDE